jgi:alpha-galactosidase
MAPPKFPDSTYEPSWCAWGYERDFKIQDMIETLPKAKELGFKWAVLDDGWQIAEGDWRLNKEKFPNGDADMRALVARIKDAGMHARIWWAPLAADPGTPIYENEKDALLLDKHGKPVHITWWDSYYLCPAYLKNHSSSKDLVKKMIGDWGYEGLKIDGQHLNGVPQCFNPAHKHTHPEESVESLQEYWKMIYETAISINENAVVEICPCGDSYSYFNVPYMNQAVASDPLNSWQIRLKGKTLKALMGESAPYSGDHVELSDHKMDFASSVGIGAVIATKFTWPEYKVPEKGYSLTKEKEKFFKKWVDIYNQKMLSKGIYRGELYDIGFDKPEAHAIEKGRNMYYALYAESYSGKFTFKGLKSGRYKVIDYENDKQLAIIEGTNPGIQLSFENHLLIEVAPID